MENLLALKWSPGLKNAYVDLTLNMSKGFVAQTITMHSARRALYYGFPGQNITFRFRHELKFMRNVRFAKVKISIGEISSKNLAKRNKTKFDYI
jgi:hypothetical protein